MRVESFTRRPKYRPHSGHVSRANTKLLLRRTLGAANFHPDYVICGIYLSIFIIATVPWLMPIALCNTYMQSSGFSPADRQQQQHNVLWMSRRGPRHGPRAGTSAKPVIPEIFLRSSQSRDETFSPWIVVNVSRRWDKRISCGKRDSNHRTAVQCSVASAHYTTRHFRFKRVTTQCMPNIRHKYQRFGKQKNLVCRGKTKWLHFVYSLDTRTHTIEQR